MSAPDPTPAHIAFFREHGWLAVPDGVSAEDLDAIEARCVRLRDDPDRYGLRMAEGVDQGRVLQSMLELVWLDWKSAPFFGWVQRFAEALVGAPLRLWYNQLLDKPPLNGAPTEWHQDGAFLGDGVGQRLISCWIPMRAVDLDSGCMHFLDRGHTDGVLHHARLADRDCAFGPCEVDPTRVVACPLPRGGVTFHHGLTPHMTLRNRSDAWRQVVIMRFFQGDPPGTQRS
ncbi:MAG: phytanoyl-CoA dioxygenase family protein [Alphaproteobacteria bacterium]|nr:phytanoyl-CoA dioxygenase family protein [Alphaproteobacteria bacterium]